MTKKLVSIILALVLVLSLGLVGCKDEDPSTSVYDNETEGGTEAGAEAGTEAEPEAAIGEGMIVGLVTDIGGIDDKSFNQGTYEGLLEFAAETGAESTYLQSDTDADYVSNLSALSDDELDLIVAAGYLFADSMTEVSANYPDQNYLLIDMVVGADNVASAVFAEQEGSFLAGVATALSAQAAGADTVGFLGGMEGELIGKFEAGFEAGVWAIDPEMTVLIEYAGSFSDSQIGQTKAAYMYDQGAYAIYQAAGGAGNGVIKEAKNRRTNGEDVWAIGVDKDQYEEGIYDEEGNSAILTSMMKRVDAASYDVAMRVLNGEFPGGEVLVYNLENGGVSLPEENPNLTDDIMAIVEEYEAKVLSGEIEVPTVPSRLQ